MFSKNPLPSLSACSCGSAGLCTMELLFGEFLDILWAPISAVIFWRRFGGPRLFAVLNFIERSYDRTGFYSNTYNHLGYQMPQEKKVSIRQLQVSIPRVEVLIKDKVCCVAVAAFHIHFLLITWPGKTAHRRASLHQCLHV